MARIRNETNDMFELETDTGDIVPLAKTAQNMAPGGIYEQAKLSTQVAGPADMGWGGGSSTAVPTIDLGSQSQVTTPPATVRQPSVMGASGSWGGPGPSTEVTGNPPNPKVDTATSLTSTPTSTKPLTLKDTEEQTTRTVYTPADLAKINAAQATQAKAISDTANVEAKLEKDKGEAQKSLAALQSGQATEYQQEEALQQDRNNRFLEAYNQKQAEYASTEIKPRSYFEDGNIGQNIMAGIAIMMGAVGGALQGTNKNVAIDVMDRAIENDLNAQKANLNKKGEAVTQARLAYEAARQAGFDHLNAVKKVQADIYKSAATYLESTLATSNSEAAIQKGKIGAENFLASAAEKDAEANASKHVKVIHEKDVVPEKSKNPIKVESGQQDKIHELANSIDSSYELRELAAIQNSTGPIGGKLIQIQNRFPGLGISSEADLQIAMARLGSQVKKEMIGGSQSAQELEGIQKWMPEEGDKPDILLKKIDGYLNSAHKRMDKLKESYGEAENFKFPSYRDARRQKEKDELGITSAPRK